MIWTTSPGLPVRGHRNYIRGVDFYSATVDLLVQNDNVPFNTLTLRFPRFSTKVGKLVLANPASFDPARWKQSPVRVSLTTRDGADLRGWYEEQHSEAPRVSGAENLQIEKWEQDTRKAMSIDAGEFVVKGNDHVPAIETIVSANKFYLQDRFRDSPGQWAFSGLELIRAFAPDDSKHLRVVFLGDHEARTTSSSIFAGGENLGTLFFSRIV